MSEVEQLRTFVTAVDCGSFSAAARKMGKAQSAVSATISNLEVDLNLTLFDRDKYRPILTEEGKSLLRYARAALEGVTTFRAHAEALNAPMEPNFSLFVEDGLLARRVRDLLVELSNTFPGLELTVEQTTKRNTLDAIKAEEADAAFVVQAEPSEQFYQCRGIGFQRVVPVCQADHPLAKITRLSRSQLADHRQIVDHAIQQPNLSDRQFSPNIWVSSNSTAKKAMVLSGLGWAELPVVTVEEEVLGGQLVVLDYGFAQNSILYTVDLVTCNASASRPVMKWLIEQIGAWDQRAWIGNHQVGEI
ncbi:LysR family transcriptional regulator [Ruegeria lacuscaerulensis]|uniref:LysR family transcriptional regulator n=1 Tax=Ruegeria lacuscaerulensis TaxID=55218 RepID=UPI00147FD440|nr:LysR family transcriptional regulator [Ruegeria lacuscaerulensis]